MRRSKEVRTVPGWVTGGSRSVGPEIEETLKLAALLAR